MKPDVIASRRAMSRSLFAPSGRVVVKMAACWGCLILMLASVMAPGSLRAAEPPAVAAATTNGPVKAAGEDSVEVQRMLRSYLQLQEQLHATLLAVEQTRLENSTATRTNSEVLAGRLELIEKSLVQAREQQQDAARNSNRTMLTLAGIFVGVGFLILLSMAFFQLRGMNRLAEIATGFPGVHALGAGGFGAGGPVESRMLSAAGDSSQGSRLQSVIERLEQRIEELEGSAHSIPVTGRARGGQMVVPAENDEPLAGHVAVLLGKGQTLLSLGQGEAALQCFEEVLVLAPEHAEAHVKRGMALERLKRFDEAVECCDRAIALNRQLTQAYLCKGSAFNQQERYSEALECFEQALKSEAVR
ncbi:MAG: hypothetical protein QOF48_834 [Verrucomicrobiota bacterium]|jgi:tetratricopeptide (TPR) repeat protein